MRSLSLIVLVFALGTFACKKKGTADIVEYRLEHYPLSQVPNLGKAVDVTCWSAGVKIFEGQADSGTFTVRGERILHFRTHGAVENGGTDEYVRVTGDCVARYTARRE